MVFLQITLNVLAQNRAAAAAVYTQFRGPFMAQAKGALSKDLLVREEDVQVLHRFDSAENVQAYLGSAMFKQDVVSALSPLLQSPPDIRVYSMA